MRIASLLAAVLLVASCGSSSKKVREPDDEDEEATDTTGSGAGSETAPPPVTPGHRPPRPAEGVAATLGDEQQLTADTPVHSEWDATIPVPSGWFVAQGPHLVRLQDPERAITIGVSAIDDVDNANVAILDAWKLLDPGFALPIRQSVDSPGRDGWDAQTQVTYVTRAEDARLVVALARKKGSTWHVITLDGKLAAVARGGAQTSSIANDLKVPGLEIESYADNTATLDKDHLKRFAALVEAARAQAGVPGAAVAIVHGGKVVFSQGFGVRSIRTRKPVTASTRFLIGGTTTALTSFLVARLVDQGKLAWDAPLAGALPGFALANTDDTARVQVRHTLCACTGLPRQDLEQTFEFQGWDADKRLASLATMTPTGFGETYQPSDLMTAAGGWAAGHAFDGKDKLPVAFDKAMKKLVLDPLKMRHTTFDFRKAGGHDFASPNGQNLDQGWVELPVAYEEGSAGLAPARGAWSTAGDLASYMLVELAKGARGHGKPLVGEQALLARRAPGVKIDEESSYGLGLMVTSDHGVTVLHQGGGTMGFTSDLFMLPDQDVGVVVLTNAGATSDYSTANAFLAAVRQGFLEIAFDGRAQAQGQLTAALGVIRTTALRESQLLAPVDDDFAAALAGTYQAPGLGTITIAKKGEYQLDAGEWTTGLAKKTDRDRTVKLFTTTPPFLGFALAPQGDGSLVLEARQQVVTFTRGSAPPAEEPPAAPPADDQPSSGE
ncbi:MAG TPA: serine hydrolase domain-containing protein [Kofleriaceae bacterium]|nr:serine hydrolase domain-containing protein [Kofleriaceae bacterium]